MIHIFACEDELPKGSHGHPRIDIHARNFINGLDEVDQCVKIGL
jgi:putative heme iron utilization protein